MTNETTTKADAPTPLWRVQRAAVRRALTDPADAARHFAFAGALDAAKRSVDRPATTSESGAAALADAIIASVLVRGVERTISDGSGEAISQTDRVERGSRSKPPTPKAAPTPNLGGQPQPLAVGAALAHAEFGVDFERAATLAGLSADEVNRALTEIE